MDQGQLQLACQIANETLPGVVFEEQTGISASMAGEGAEDKRVTGCNRIEQVFDTGVCRFVHVACLDWKTQLESI
jgi:hypothetical protein